MEPEPGRVYCWERAKVSVSDGGRRGRRPRATTSVRELNQRLHDLEPGDPTRWRISNPNGAHAVAVGLDAEIEVEIDGHVGYYCAGMNKLATVRVDGNCGIGVAENIMSGTVRRRGRREPVGGATGRGGLLVIRGTRRRAAESR